MFPVKRRMEAMARFGAARVVVIGDLIADEYLYGKLARISREAPVLILRSTGREVRLAGAAEAADNVHALGAAALAIGLLGEDQTGDAVAHLLGQAASPPMAR